MPVRLPSGKVISQAEAISTGQSGQLIRKKKPIGVKRPTKGGGSVIVTSGGKVTIRDPKGDVVERFRTSRKAAESFVSKEAAKVESLRQQRITAARIAQVAKPKVVTAPPVTKTVDLAPKISIIPSQVRLQQQFFAGESATPEQIEQQLEAVEVKKKPIEEKFERVEEFGIKFVKDPEFREEVKERLKQKFITGEEAVEFREALKSKDKKDVQALIEQPTITPAGIGRGIAADPETFVVSTLAGLGLGKLFSGGAKGVSSVFTKSDEFVSAKRFSALGDDLVPAGFSREAGFAVVGREGEVIAGVRQTQVVPTAPSLILGKAPKVIDPSIQIKLPILQPVEVITLESGKTIIRDIPASSTILSSRSFFQESLGRAAAKPDVQVGLGKFVDIPSKKQPFSLEVVADDVSIRAGEGFIVGKKGQAGISIFKSKDVFEEFDVGRAGERLREKTFGEPILFDVPKVIPSKSKFVFFPSTVIGEVETFVPPKISVKPISSLVSKSTIDIISSSRVKTGAIQLQEGFVDVTGFPRRKEAVRLAPALRVVTAPIVSVIPKSAVAVSPALAISPALAFRTPSFVSARLKQPFTSQLSKAPSIPSQIVGPSIVPSRRVSRALFDVFIRRRGKDVGVAGGLSLVRARAELVGRLKGGLAASGFVEVVGGRRLGVSELGLGGEFVRSKVDPFRVVQRRGKRLGTKRERRAIQLARRNAFFGKSKAGGFL